MAGNDEQFFKFDELEKDGTEWFRSCLSWCGVPTVRAMDSRALNRTNIRKDDLAKRLYEGMKIIERQNHLIANLREQAQVLKTTTISCQASVIRLQEELISSKDDQLGALQSAVVSSVEESVKTELRSYSEVASTLSSASKPPSAAYSRETLKSVVKHVVEEEDRSRNIMVFGLPESENEILTEKIGELFKELDEKPKLEAARLGKSGSTRSRPVKVSLSSSVNVQQIMRKARNLRLSEEYKTVFLTPDRSAEERVIQKQLVLDLKKRKSDEPDKIHYLKDGEICSKDKSVK